MGSDGIGTGGGEGVRRGLGGRRDGWGLEGEGYDRVGWGGVETGGVRWDVMRRGGVGQGEMHEVR